MQVFVTKTTLEDLFIWSDLNLSSMLITQSLQF
jgi:hypothetical protein